jgi:hypothetical protein
MIEKKIEKKNCKVTFVLDKNDFSEFDDIRVLGDFNGWHYEKGLIMELKKGQFKSSVTVKAGINYEFRYILNGRHWFNDPQGDGLVDSPFYGISNTLIIINEADGSESKVAKTKTVEKTIPATAETVAPAPKVEKAPVVKKAAPAPKAEKVPVVKKAAPAPKAEKTPVVKKAVTAPKAEKVPVVKKAAPAPKVVKAPVVKKAAPAPKAEKASTVKKA